MKNSVRIKEVKLNFQCRNLFAVDLQLIPHKMCAILFYEWFKWITILWNSLKCKTYYYLHKVET